MLNQIEKHFEYYMSAMYVGIEISEAQEKDIEKTFYAGMLVAYFTVISLDDNEDVAISQLDSLYSQVNSKIESLI